MPSVFRELIINKIVVSVLVVPGFKRKKYKVTALSI